jgi:hypothetical protein
MATKFLANLNLSQNELQNARIQNLTTTQIDAISSPVDGQIVFDTTTDKIKYYNGTAWVAVDDGAIKTVSGTAPIQVSTSGSTATVSIDAADADSAGSMSSTHFNLVDGATNSNTVSTIVKRDSSGNFSAGTITAALTGTASNASQLNNQNASHYLDRTNHTGTQASSTISDLATTVKGYRLDEFATPNTNVAFGSNRITGLADPQNAQDAATKAYVDASRLGLDIKDSVRVATTAAVVLSSELEAGDTLDTVTLVAGNRVLVKNQGTASENGIYVVQATGAAVRATDFDSTAEVTPGAFVFVEEGSQGDSGWVVTTDGTITVGSTAITWAQFSGAGQITAGSALSKSGNTLDVNVDNSTIEVSSDALRVKDAGITAAKLAVSAVDLATSTVTGTLPVLNGGTGATTAAGAKTSLGFMTRYTETITAVANTPYTVTHSLGTKNVIVNVYDTSDAMVIADIVTTSTNAITLTSSLAADYRVVVIG